MEKTILGFGDYLYGYVNGERVLISNTVEQICAFIMKYRLTDVKIVDILDQLEIETSMGFILYAKNQQFLASTLIPALAPMQMGEVESPKFTPHVKEGNYIVSNVRVDSSEGHFLGIISFEEGYPEFYDKQSEYFETEEELKEAYPDSISWSEATNSAISKGWMKEDTE